MFAGNRRRREAIKSAARRGKKREIDFRKLFRELGEWLLIVLIAAVLGYSVVHFGGQTVRVVGYSMNDVLDNGDVVLVNKLGYLLSSPKRYDVVAFKLRKSDEYYNVKRVIGLPGETVRITDGKLYINDKLLTDVPFTDYILTPGVASEGVTLLDNEYFLMGDNCNNSEDSRFANIGNVLDKEILGKVTRIVAPKGHKRKVK